MEKYYITRMAELEPGLSATSRLLEVQFLRRSPTIGLLFMGKTTKNNSCCGCVKLATLSLNSKNKAKFANTNREVPLTGVRTTLVSFDTYNRGQLLVEGSYIAGNIKALEHLMSSSVFALTQSGQILVVSMLLGRDGDVDNSWPSELLKECRPLTPQVGAQNKFLQLQVQPACIPQDSSGQADTGDRILHVLSQQCYFAYSMRLKQPPPGGATSPRIGQPPACPRYLDLCELVLEQEYSLVASASTPADLLQPVELTRMLPIDSRGSVLLESSDGLLRVIRQGQCVWTIAAPSGSQRAGPRQSLLLLQSREAAAGAASGARDDPDNILLSLTSNNQLVAHSLSISSRDSAAGGRGQAKSKQKREDTDLFEMLDEDSASGDNRDPDRLLPQEPSFELDECWSIELNQLLDSVSGLSLALESSDDEDSAAGGGYLCVPLWLPRCSSASSEDESTHRWPQFLLLFHSVHVLVFSFEQENSLPFSVVYDRAFMNLTGGGESGNDPAGKQPPAGQPEKRVDLRARPRLLHNIKLVGTQPSDCLFNLIFLSPSGGGASRRRPAYINQARHFNQLGLMAATTSEGHLFAFKLTSPQVVDSNRKDNLYQQVLLDSLRDESLLRDELDRLEEISSQLREDTTKLEGMLKEGAGRGSTESEGAARMPTGGGGGGGGRGHLFESHPGSREIQVRLEHHAVVGGLYELVVEWPGSVLCVVKVIVLSTADGCEIWPPLAGGGGGSLIENIQISDSKTGELGPFCQHDSNTWKAMAVLELKSHGGESPAADENTQRVRVPLFLQDGQTAARHVKVYVIFFERTHMLQANVGGGGMDADNHQLLAMKSLNFNYLQHKLEASSSTSTSAMASHSGKGQLNSFILHEIPVKPLMSYRLLAPHEEARVNISGLQTDTLEASGPFSGEQLLSWLDELLDMTLHGDNPNLSSLKFKSNLTGCSIDVEIAQVLTTNGRASTVNRMLVTSQDPGALGLIKRHTLKRATDCSMRLDIRHSEGDDKKRAYLVDKQRQKNSELVESVKRVAAAGSLKAASHDDQTQLTAAQKDLLLDNLLNEIDQIELNGLLDHNLFGLATGELMKSTNFLERSLRQDIEQLFGN